MYAGFCRFMNRLVPPKRTHAISGLKPNNMCHYCGEFVAFVSGRFLPAIEDRAVGCCLECGLEIVFGVIPSPQENVGLNGASNVPENNPSFENAIRAIEDGA